MSNEADPISPEEMQSALFAQLVMQQASMAMTLLGKTPHPQTGKTERDLDGAKFFIDQLEMLEAKTKGNLSRQEQALLQQNLMALRLEFVEAVKTPAPAEKLAAVPSAEPASKEPAPATPPPEDTGSKKRFSKKY
jgi:hypothetical protein